MERFNKVFFIISAIIIVLLITISSFLISKSIKEKENTDTTEIILARVDAEMNEKCTDLMLLSTEDDWQQYAVLGQNGLYLVNVKFKNGKVTIVTIKKNLLE